MTPSQYSVQKIKDNIRSLGSALFLALAVRIFAFEPFNIPSGSMIPSFLVGDYLFVSRYIYGYSRYSIPFGYAIPFFEGRILQNRGPTQGEVVVFRIPSDLKTDYIKRVIGLPGDRVQLKDGIVFVNDEPATVKKIGPYVSRAEENGGMVHATLYEETLPNGVKHPIIKHDPFGANDLDNTPEFTVPEGHYFVMGDNRDRSKDSRVMHAVGFIPNDVLIGRAEVIFFSTDGRGPWNKPWKWPTAIRWGTFPRLVK
jgi:signal peptidase I